MAPSKSSFPPSAAPVVALICSVGFGFLSRRLWTFANSLQAKSGSLHAQLAAAPTIPFSTLKHRRISSEGELVLIQDGAVSPLVDQERRLWTSSGQEAVVVKTVEYTDQPKEFKDVYRGFWLEHVSKIPFALVAYENIDNNNNNFVVFVKADADHLPLVQESHEKSPLDPPVFLTKRVSTKKNEESDTSESDSEYMYSEAKSEEMDVVASSVIQVNKVTWKGYLGVGTKLKNVFGVLRKRENGVVEIESCPLFPKKCFTMSRSEIQEAVRAKADNDAFNMRVWSVAVGFAPFTYLLFRGV